MDIDLVTGRLDWSQELYEIYGMKRGVDIPTPDELWKHDHTDDAHQVLRAVSRSRYNRTPYNLDHRIVRLDGETRWVQEQGAYTYDAAGEPARFIGTMLDITDRKRAEDRVEFLAGHDQLTGLPNYALLLDRLSQSIVQVQRDNFAVAVAFLDVDRFKDVNDAVGYAAGDEVLKEIARRLQDSVRPGDTVSRVGGDEFIAILSNVHKTTEIGSTAHKILSAFNSPFRAGEEDFYFSASMGVSVYPNDRGDASQLIRNADMAMYQGKGKARNNFQFFSAQMHERTTRRLSLELALRHARERDELILMYQPIIDALDCGLLDTSREKTKSPSGSRYVVRLYIIRRSQNVCTNAYPVPSVLCAICGAVSQKIHNASRHGNGYQRPMRFLKVARPKLVDTLTSGALIAGQRDRRSTRILPSKGGWKQCTGFLTY